MASRSTTSAELASKRTSMASMGSRLSVASVGLGEERLCAWFLKAPEKVGTARRRYFQLHKREIVYFESESKGKGVNKKGAIEITPVTRAVAEGRELQIHNTGRTYLLTAEDAAQTVQWQFAIGARVADMSEKLANAAMTGWLVKAADGVGQARRRYFVCEGSSVKYYDGENVGAAKLKGQFQVNSFSRVELVQQTIRVENPTRTWLLTADDATQAARWASALLEAQTHAETAGDEPGSSGDEQDSEDKFIYPGRGVWMFKDGARFTGALRGPQRRFFTVLYGSDPTTVKFAYFRRVLDGQPLDLRGFVPIRAATTIAAADGSLTITNSDRVWTLFGEDEDDADRWCEILDNCRALIPPFAAAAALPAPDTPLLPATATIFGAASTVSPSDVLMGGGEGKGLEAAAGAVFGGRSVRNSGSDSLSGAGSNGPDLPLSSFTNTAASSRGPSSAFGGVANQEFEVVNETELDEISNPNAVPVALTALQAKAGIWLTKEAERVGNARRRYFIIGRNEVQYFVNERGGLKGTIALSGAGLRQQGPTVTLVTPEREWKLTADSDADAAMFVSYVTAALVDPAPATIAATTITAVTHQGPVQLTEGGPVHDAVLGRDLILRITPAEPGGAALAIPVLRSSLVAPANDRVALINPSQVIELLAEPGALVAWITALRAARTAATRLAVTEEEAAAAAPVEVSLDQLSAPRLSAFTTWGAAGSVLDLRSSHMDLRSVPEESFLARSTDAASPLPSTPASPHLSRAAVTSGGAASVSVKSASKQAGRGAKANTTKKAPGGLAKCAPCCTLM